MNTVTKVSAFGLVLAVVFGGAWAIGTAAGPLGGQPGGTSPDAAHDMADSADTGHTDAGHAGHAGHAGAAGPDAGAALPGLATAQNGYALVAERQQLPAQQPVPFRFRIVDGTATALTRFEIEHDKRLHLVVVRRDGTHYQHVHPEMSQDGTWSVPLALPAAGSYRVFADFKPEGGAKTTLGTDVHVAGDYQPQTDATESRSSTVDGYTVRLAGAVAAGADSTVTATVTRDGQPVTDLQPYLGAYGHLVALRGSDLAYLHVHPHGTPGDGSTAAGPDITFSVAVPTPGTYRMFLDFQHDGVVRTAPFTIVVGGTAMPAGSPGSGGDHGGGDHGGGTGGDDHGGDHGGGGHGG